MQLSGGSQRIDTALVPGGSGSGARPRPRDSSKKASQEWVRSHLPSVCRKPPPLPGAALLDGEGPTLGQRQGGVSASDGPTPEGFQSPARANA